MSSRVLGVAVGVGIVAAGAVVAAHAGAVSPSRIVTSPVPTAAASAPTPGIPVARKKIETRLGVTYATVSPTQTLDLYLPVSAGKKPVPVVVLIHGGAFSGGDSSNEAVYAQRLVRLGFAAASLNYRLSGEAAFPAGAQDVKAAVRWLRAHAGTYGLDTRRFGAWGQSAGGWMAGMLGATGDQKTVFDDPRLGNAGQSSAVQAVVAWYAPSNFATMDAQASTVAACGGQALRHGPAGSPESVWLGEPVVTSSKVGLANLGAYASTAVTLPPWYLAHGDSDCTVPPGQSAEFRRALMKRAFVLKKGARNDVFVVLKGAGHADPAFDATQIEPAVAFLRTRLGL